MAGMDITPMSARAISHTTMRIDHVISPGISGHAFVSFGSAGIVSGAASSSFVSFVKKMQRKKNTRKKEISANAIMV